MGTRKIHEVAKNGVRARVYRDGDGEYQVKLDVDRKALAQATYFTNDRPDALGTATAMVESQVAIEYRRAAKAARLRAARVAHAAPAMHKALSDILEWCAGGDLPDELTLAGYAALALANGEPAPTQRQA